MAALIIERKSGQLISYMHMSQPKHVLLSLYEGFTISKDHQGESLFPSPSPDQLCFIYTLHIKYPILSWI